MFHRDYSFAIIIGIVCIGSMLIPGSNSCPNKIRKFGSSVGGIISTKFKGLRKSKDAVGSTTQGISAAGIKNPGCKNPFFPCDDPGILGAATSVVGAATKATKGNAMSKGAKLRLAGAAALAAGGAVGIGVLANKKLRKKGNASPGTANADQNERHGGTGGPRKGEGRDQVDEPAVIDSRSSKSSPTESSPKKPTESVDNEKEKEKETSEEESSEPKEDSSESKEDSSESKEDSSESKEESSESKEESSESKEESSEPKEEEA